MILKYGNSEVAIDGTNKYSYVHVVHIDRNDNLSEMMNVIMKLTKRPLYVDINMNEDYSDELFDVCKSNNFDERLKDQKDVTYTGRYYMMVLHGTKLRLFYVSGITDKQLHKDFTNYDEMEKFIDSLRSVGSRVIGYTSV